MIENFQRLFRVRFPRDKTAAQWAASNPVLFNGEPSIETDTGKMKIGDGSTAWNSLAHFAGGGGCCEPLTNGDPANPELVFANADVIMVEM